MCLCQFVLATKHGVCLVEDKGYFAKNKKKGEEEKVLLDAATEQAKSTCCWCSLLFPRAI